MGKNINDTVSVYYDAKDATSTIYLKLDEVLLNIVGKDYLKQQTDIVRMQTTKEAYIEEKRKLPMIAPSGIFTYRNDNIGNLREYSNIMVLDFDKFPNHEAANEFKQK